MPNSYFQFKQFRIEQAKAGMKVTTDGCFMGSAIPFEKNARILDIGTGTGLLALVAAQQTEQAIIDAIEIDEDAFEQAKANFTNSPWADRINIYHNSLQDFEPKHCYDQIICNPPFFKASQKGQSSQKNKAVHNDLLSFADLAKHASRLLSPQGEFWVMYPEQEMNEFCEIAQKFDLLKHSRLILRNKQDGPVFRVIREFCKEERPYRSTYDGYIKEEDGSYSESFRKHLKAFYLHL